MSNWVERREDGSITFFIDGDLQFDSRDERVYHECLALPALALAVKKRQKARALIVGGGDGLSARELLKDSLVEHIDLVDIDSEVLDLGHSAFAELNQRSLSDARLSVHLADAWNFVGQAIERGDNYDLIVVDLTVAQDLSGARFHSIEWYGMLSQLLGTIGVMATNAASPSATPAAYFCIFNSIRSAGLQAVPYRVSLPSFSALGYGLDWGFILASPDASIVESLKLELNLPSERYALNDCAHLRKLFVFPWEVFQFQEEAVPAGKDSEILLHYFYNGEEVELKSGRFWNALSADLDKLEIPEADVGTKLIPAQIRDMLADDQADEEVLFSRVLEMMPALHRFQTSSMIKGFLEDPGVFLESIDLPALVEALLDRACELPDRFVVELNLLQQSLGDWSGEHSLLFELGTRLTTIVAVVVILGNLLYPDAVFGKGEHGGGGHQAGHGAHAGGEHGGHGEHAGADRGFGRGGDRGFGRGGDRGFNHPFNRAANHNWNHGWDNHRDNWGHWNAWGGHWGHWGGWARPWHRWWGGGWGGWTGWAPWAGWGLPVYGGLNINLNNNSIDEQGNQYPIRTYNYDPTYVTEYGAAPPVVTQADQTAVQLPLDGAPSAAAEQATAGERGLYRLGPDTDILPDGRLVMQLTANSYLKIDATQTEVVDQAVGAPVMTLHSDPSLRWHLFNEMQRQQNSLQAAIQSKHAALDSSDNLGFQKQGTDARGELSYMHKMDGLLTTAQKQFGTVGDQPGPPQTPPLPGALEVFTSVWLTPDGDWLIIKRPDGSLAYMNGQGWYSDRGNTKLAAPYPAKFQTVMAGYLGNLALESSSALSSLNQDKQEAQHRLDKLNQDLQSLLPQAGAQGEHGEVEYGAETVQAPEALRRTKLAIRRAQHRLDFVSKELQSIPVETAAANKMLAQFHAQGGR